MPYTSATPNFPPTHLLQNDKCCTASQAKRGENDCKILPLFFFFLPVREGEEGQRDICQKWIAVGFRTELVKLLWVVNLSVSLFLGRGQEICPERQRIDQKKIAQETQQRKLFGLLGNFGQAHKKWKMGFVEALRGEKRWRKQLFGKTAEQICLFYRKWIINLPGALFYIFLGQNLPTSARVFVFFWQSAKALFFFCRFGDSRISRPDHEVWNLGRWVVLLRMLRWW